MDQRTKLLCENVFELSAMAEELQIIGSITVEDSHERIIRLLHRSAFHDRRQRGLFL